MIKKSNRTLRPLTLGIFLIVAVIFAVFFGSEKTFKGSVTVIPGHDPATQCYAICSREETQTSCGNSVSTPSDAASGCNCTNGVYGYSFKGRKCQENYFCSNQGCLPQPAIAPAPYSENAACSLTAGGTYGVLLRENVFGSDEDGLCYVTAGPSDDQILTLTDFASLTDKLSELLIQSGANVTACVQTNYYSVCRSLGSSGSAVLNGFWNDRVNTLILTKASSVQDVNKNGINDRVESIRDPKVAQGFAILSRTESGVQKYKAFAADYATQVDAEWRAPVVMALELRGPVVAMACDDATPKNCQVFSRDNEDLVSIAKNITVRLATLDVASYRSPAEKASLLAFYQAAYRPLPPPPPVPPPPPALPPPPPAAPAACGEGTMPAAWKQEYSLTTYHGTLVLRGADDKTVRAEKAPQGLTPSFRFSFVKSSAPAETGSIIIPSEGVDVYLKASNNKITIPGLSDPQKYLKADKNVDAASTQERFTLNAKDGNPSYLCVGTGGTEFTLKKADKFVSAQPNGEIQHNRNAASIWETFKAVQDLPRERCDATGDEDFDGFADGRDFECRGQACGGGTGYVWVWSDTAKPGESIAKNQSRVSTGAGCCLATQCKRYSANECVNFEEGNTANTPQYICGGDNNWLSCDSPEARGKLSGGGKFFCNGTLWMACSSTNYGQRSDGGAYVCDRAQNKWIAAPQGTPISTGAAVAFKSYHGTYLQVNTSPQKGPVGTIWGGPPRARVNSTKYYVMDANTFDAAPRPLHYGDAVALKSLENNQHLQETDDGDWVRANKPAASASQLSPEAKFILTDSSGGTAGGEIMEGAIVGLKRSDYYVSTKSPSETNRAERNRVKIDVFDILNFERFTICSTTCQR